MHNAPDAPLNDNRLPDLRSATLEFVRQKNAVKGKCVGHSANDEPFFCPAKALACIARRLKHNNAQPTTPTHTTQNQHPSIKRPTLAKSTCITNAIQHAAKAHIVKCVM